MQQKDLTELKLQHRRLLNLHKKYQARIQRYLDFELREHCIVKGSLLGNDSTFGFSYTVTGYGPEVEKLYVMKLSFATDKEAESQLK